MADRTGLTDEERAELEELRAEKAAREQAERAAAERGELERLRRQKADDEAMRASVERGRALMEPDDDDLRMPLGQKVVILAVVGVAIVWLAATVLG